MLHNKLVKLTKNTRNKKVVKKSVSAINQQIQQITFQEGFFITGNCLSISGYDNLVKEVASGLLAQGLPIKLNALCSFNPSVCPQEFNKIIHYKPNNCKDLIINTPPNIAFHNPTKNSTILTMWETDKLHESWVKSINLANKVIVPSLWGKECFIKSGVTIPVEIVPLGYNPIYFYPTWKKNEVFTFGSAASLGGGGFRKNTYEIIKLFKKAFPNENNIKLKIKVSPRCILPDETDTRIEIQKKFLSEEQLGDWYRSIDCFISASYAEGFGLHLIESMACGVPVISTNYSAPNDFLNKDNSYLVKYELTEANGGQYFGNWGMPCIPDFLNQIKMAFDEKKEVIKKSRNAFIDSRKYTWENTIRGIIKLISV